MTIKDVFNGRTITVTTSGIDEALEFLNIAVNMPSNWDEKSMADQNRLYLS